METDKNYFLVGLFVLALMAGLIGFTLWLTASDQEEMVYYRARFVDSVSGLADESAVKFRGVNVGQVEKIAIDPSDGKVLVDIAVQKGTPVHADSVATLQIKGITGDLYVGITPGSQKAPLLEGQTDKDAEPTEIAAGPNEIDKIMKRTSVLMNKLDHIADQGSKVFSDENVKSVNRVMGWFSDDDDEEDAEENNTHLIGPHQTDRRQR